MGRWPQIVGTDVAAHSTPVSFADGILTVRADSTAWATQLRLMSSSILGRLEAEVGKEAVSELRVERPRRAELEPRLAPGPGPRPARHLRLTGRPAASAADAPATHVRRPTARPDAWPAADAVREPLGTPGA